MARSGGHVPEGAHAHRQVEDGMGAQKSVQSSWCMNSSLRMSMMQGMHVACNTCLGSLHLYAFDVLCYHQQQFLQNNCQCPTASQLAQSSLRPGRALPARRRAWRRAPRCGAWRTCRRTATCGRSPAATARSACSATATPTSGAPVFAVLDTSWGCQTAVKRVLAEPVPLLSAEQRSARTVHGVHLVCFWKSVNALCCSQR